MRIPPRNRSGSLRNEEIPLQPVRARSLRFLSIAVETLAAIFSSGRTCSCSCRQACIGLVVWSDIGTEASLSNCSVSRALFCVSVRLRSNTCAIPGQKSIILSSTTKSAVSLADDFAAVAINRALRPPALWAFLTYFVFCGCAG